MANLYWQDSGSQAWEDPLNWWVDDTAIIPAGFAPWIDADVPPTYLGYDLTLALGATNAPIIGVAIGVAIGTDATGTCNIYSVLNGGTINGGTFSGASFSNVGTIFGGTFSGADFFNGGTIFGGSFSGDNFYNGGGIEAGTFSGSDFGNYNTIFGGSFSGSGFRNFGGTINGQEHGTPALFSGSDFLNNGTIISGTFIYPAVNISTNGGNTFLSVSGFGVAFGYPTPASGGSDQMIARLLNLPWFINL